MKNGLNRTSVGLKLRYTGNFVHNLAQPQSNQRGIETLPLTRACTRAIMWGLNRTSVGLKRDAGAETLQKTIPLNRTSVGLKPRPKRAGRWNGGTLNRTSVGLKRSSSP